MAPKMPSLLAREVPPLVEREALPLVAREALPFALKPSASAPGLIAVDLELDL